MVTDPVVLALTRPVTLYGVPQKLLMAELFLAMIVTLYCNAGLKGSLPEQYAFVLASTIGISIFAALFNISRLIARKDQNRFAVLFTAIRRTPRVLNFGFWGGVNSYGAN